MSGDLVLPCDHAALAAAVARLWPAAAAVAGVDPALVEAGVFQRHDGTLVLYSRGPSLPGARHDPAADRALEELVRSLEDAHYVVRREGVRRTGSARVVLGEAAARECRCGLPLSTWHPSACFLVRIADLEPWHPAREERARRLMRKRQERDAATAPAANAKDTRRRA